MRWGSHWCSGLADTEDLFLFSKVLIIFSQRKKLFPCLCVTTLKSFSASNFAQTSSVFLQRLRGGLRGKARSHQICIWKALVPHFWGCGIARRLAKSFWGFAETVKTADCDYSIRHLDFRFVASDEPARLQSSLFCCILVELSSLGMQKSQGSSCIKRPFCMAHFVGFSRTNIPL